MGRKVVSTHIFSNFIMIQEWWEISVHNLYTVTPFNIKHLHF